jgi:hypothetical protein
MCFLVMLGLCRNARDAEVLTASEGEDGTERTCRTDDKFDSTFGPRQTSQVRYCNMVEDTFRTI